MKKNVIILKVFLIHFCVLVHQCSAGSCPYLSICCLNGTYKTKKQFAEEIILQWKFHYAGLYNLFFYCAHVCFEFCEAGL